ncbi:MAG: hypothetical protein J6Z01_15470 [Bacteroidales bacterium]|nr:hypothetical protein [Bacteroidales bacterium]
MLSSIHTNNAASQIMALFSTMPYNEQSRIIESLNTEHQRTASLRKRFDELYDRWWQETCVYSDPNKFTSNPNFKAIVAMGKNAVPYIIEKIKIFPSDLVKALNLIYNRRISPDKKVTIKEACRLWIEKLGY